MRIIISTILCASILVASAPSAFAVVSVKGFDTGLPADRYDPCRNKTGNDRLRCQSRLDRSNSAAVVRRLKRASGEESQVNRVRLRLAEQAKRAERNAELLERRRSVSKSLTDLDHNTRRLTYLQAYRKDRIACMLETPGRPRRLCLERVQNMLNIQMKAARGLKRFR